MRRSALWGCSMQTGHLASPHSLTFSLLSGGFLGNECLERLELLENGDALDLLKDTERSLLSFGISIVKYHPQL